MDDEQAVEQSRFYQTIAVACVVGLASIAVVLFGLEKTGKHDLDDKKKKKRKPDEVATKNSETLEVRGPFTKEEVAKHNKEEDAWIIIEGKVYDVSGYVELHPGGDTILNNVGGDSTEGFLGEQHPATAKDVLQNYYIGDLGGD